MGALPPHHQTSKERLTSFLAALRGLGFAGEVAVDEGTKTVFSTDNSIYQLEPAAVLFPRDGADLELAVRAAATSGMPITARGGGTGTNGQSLTSGVVADVSRHMNRILAFDADIRQVTVEPGVVLDQLNAWLKPHGLFFPPTVSTASRATIGGMVATDASGKGSRIYGRTSDYVERLDVVLADGSTGVVETLDGQAAASLAGRGDRLGQAAETVRSLVDRHRDAIASVFPDMNRGLTGYNLKGVTQPDGGFRLQALLAGSEGTLAITRAITLQLLARPACRGLAVVRYGSFSAALDDVSRLLLADPAAIEIMDDKVLALAREDVVWPKLEKVLGGATPRPVGGLNVVEFVGDDEDSVQAALARLAAVPVPADADVLDQIIVRDAATVSTLWDLRKKAVGLLGRLGGIPFIEDTAVPPESLPAYVRDFRALLDEHGLDYGMFGHADVGCLHVRPVLDMRDPAHAALIRPLTDAVAALTRRYGGLLWGEHGRGFRGEYSPEFFGPELYGVLCEIKAAFDPLNLFNPGKLAPAFKGGPIDRIDAVPLRGAADRQLSPALQRDFGKAVACNGNGACHGWDAFDLMCPSYKVTRDRNQSPKGRAALLREWARRKSTGEDAGEDFARFEESVKASLDTCLSCKACASLCPVKVDIPSMRAEFLADYHSRHKRPLRDLLLSRFEEMLVLARRMPALTNAVLRSAPVRALLERSFSLVDLPTLDVAPAARPPAAMPGRTVVLLEDLFTSTFDGAVVEAAETLLVRLGYRVERQPPMSNGKALQVRGFLSSFAPVARAAADRIAGLAACGHPIIALDAATGLMFADDYARVTGRAPAADVLGLEQFLAGELEAGRLNPAPAASRHFTFLPHCTEKSARPLTPRLWSDVFAAFGAVVDTPQVGCCGMAGMFGHEKEHKSLSESLFEMSWKPILDRAEPDTVLASGFSCRCQAKRIKGARLRHPAEALLEIVNASGQAALPAAGPERQDQSDAQ